MPRFKDQEGAFKLLEPGDYIVAVSQFSQDQSSSPGTNGAQRFTIIFVVEGTGDKIKEVLIDHEKTDWKLDLFLKSCGIRNLPKDTDYEFIKKDAEERGVPWINPMGLRCHIRLQHRTYTNRSGNEITVNDIATYYTDRDVLPPDPELRKRATSEVPF